MDRDLRTQTRRTYDGDQHEQAKHLVAQIRAGTKVPEPVRNAPPLNIVVPKRKHCLLHAWEDRPAAALPVLRLRAYAGDEAALSVVRLSPDLEWKRKCIEPAWLTGLLFLAEDLPPVAVSGVECECAYKTCMGCHDSRNGRQCSKCGGTERIKRRRPLKRCCNGTGTRTVTTPAPRYLAACIGLAVGRAALHVYIDRQLHRGPEDVGVAGLTIVNALDACERWTWCPCPKNEEAWRLVWATADADGQGPIWVPSPRPSIARTQASQLIKPKTVREAAWLMVLEVSC